MPIATCNGFMPTHAVLYGLGTYINQTNTKSQQDARQAADAAKATMVSYQAADGSYLQHCQSDAMGKRCRQQWQPSCQDEVHVTQDTSLPGCPDSQGRRISLRTAVTTKPDLKPEPTETERKIERARHRKILGKAT